MYMVYHNKVTTKQKILSTETWNLYSLSVHSHFKKWKCENANSRSAQIFYEPRSHLKTSGA